MNPRTPTDRAVVHTRPAGTATNSLQNPLRIVFTRLEREVQTGEDVSARSARSHLAEGSLVSAMPVQLPPAQMPTVRMPYASGSRPELSPSEDRTIPEDEMEFAPFQADKAAVAALGPVDIARLTRRELVAAIVAAELPLLKSDPDERLRFLDRWTLERLVYLARHCCRNQGY